MSDEFKIQCEVCGTLYHDLEEVCPYCGTPQPPLEPPLEEVTVEGPYPLGPVAATPPPEPDHLLEDELYPEEDQLEDTYPARHYPEQPTPNDLFADDDIFAVAGEDEIEPEFEDENFEDEDYADETFANEMFGDEAFLDEELEDELFEDEAFIPEQDEGYEEEYFEDEYDERLVYADIHAGEDFEDDEFADEMFEDEEDGEKPRGYKRRLALGCLGTLVCIGLFYGGIALYAAYNGWQERTQEVQVEAEQHYQRGQEHLARGSIELAIAEFERALSLNPNLLLAREALREAESISLSQPTPTSETRSAAAASLLEQVQTEVNQENWAEALETLSNVRDLDPNFEAEQVSDLLYEVHYQRGLSLIEQADFDEALMAFEQALVEQPNSEEAATELERIARYVEGQKALEIDDPEVAIKYFDELYQDAPAYLDVKQQLLVAYELFGDTLAENEAWCLAETQFLEAAQLTDDNIVLQSKANRSKARCDEPASAQADETTTPQSTTRPTATRPSISANTPAASNSLAATPVATATGSTPSPASTALSGSIFYSIFNLNESRWDVLAVPASGGSPRTVVTNGLMPAVSPNGTRLVYRSESIESEGFHLYDLTTGEDKRITIFRQDMLPRWGDDNQFVFAAQEPATNRWQIHLGFADGRSEALTLRDGRTPDWSATGLVAFQGTDAEGNNPGIYIVPFNGGETRRVTNHESDRSPDFSSNGSQLAYMSTQNGNWDIYTISSEGGSPRKITTYGGNDGLPVWSPDGARIAYVSDEGGQWAIYIVDAAGGSPTRLTEWDGTQRVDWLLGQISWAR